MEDPLDKQCEYSWITRRFCAHCLGHVPDFFLDSDIR